MLNNTGTSASFGGLIVSGDNGTTANGSGGTIQNSTGAGISLTNTRDVSLDQINVTNGGDDGIHGVGVVNFTLNRSNVNSNGNSTADDGLQFGEASGLVVGVSGNVAILNSSISANAHNNVHIRNTSGIIDNLTVTDSTFNDLNDTFGANSFLFEGSGTSTITEAFLTGSTFSNNSPQRALEVQAHDTANVLDFVVRDNKFANNGIHASFTQDTSSNLRFYCINNAGLTAGSAITGTVLQVINIFSSSTSTGGTIVGNVSGNNINTGATNASGISAVIQGRTTSTLLIDGNTINGTAGARGISLAWRGPTANVGPASINEVTVTNNNANNGPPAIFPTSAISLEADNQSGAFAAAPTVRADIRLNTVPTTQCFEFGTGCLQFFEYDGDGTPGEFQDGIGQLVDTPPASANADAQLSSTNTGSVTSVGISLIAGPINVPPPVPTPLLAASGGVEVSQLRDTFTISQSDLDLVFAAAIKRWRAAGITAKQISAIRSMKFEIADLPGTYLAEVAGERIIIDRDGGGYGWFVDATPMDDVEFNYNVSGMRRYTNRFGTPAGRMDLLTAIMHETGHRAGLVDSYSVMTRDNLMYGYLTRGERRLPSVGQARNAVSGSSGHSGFLLAENEEGTFGVFSVNSAPQSGAMFIAPLSINDSALRRSAIWSGSESNIALLRSADNTERHVYKHVAPPGQKPDVDSEQKRNHAKSRRAIASSAAPTSNPTTTTMLSPALAAVEVDLPNLPVGEILTVVFDVTVDSRRGSYSAQGTVTATGITPVLTDDPDIGGATDPTVTPGDCQVSFSVTSIADAGAGTLREGISQLCDGGTIDFNIAGAGPHTITLTSGQLVIDKDLTITNTSGESVTINGGGNDRIFSISASRTVSIRNLTVSGGAPTDAAGGGGILNNGTLSLINMNVSGNVSGNAIGGGISNNSVLTVINSTISGNNSGVGGGGLSGFGASTTSVINSTISGNFSDVDGGGIYALGTSAMTLINGTITNNRADNDNNATGTGGGIFRLGGTVTLRNTIVAGNFNEDGASDAADDIGGTVDAASSFNLIGTGGSGGLVNGVNNNQVGVADARLGALASNGGTTLTHALLSGSVALDTGSNGLLPADTFDLDGDMNTAEPLPVEQRGPGFPRVQDAADLDTTQTADIGAFEAKASVEDITDKSTPEDIPLSFSFNVGDASAITSVTATSSNTTLVPNLPANLSVSGAGSSRMLNITPGLNENTPASGTTTITVTVTSGTETMTDTFVLTVTEVNDAPTAGADPLTSVAEDSGVRTISIASLLANDSTGPANESGQTLMLTAVSSPVGGTVVINGANVEFTPAADFNGAASFQYTVTDNGTTNAVADPRTANGTVSFTITEVNDAPTAVNDTLANIGEDSGVRIISFTDLTANDSPGPADESGQTLTVTNVSNAVGGTVLINGTNVEFTPSANFFGTASFDYNIVDNGTTNGVADPLPGAAAATASFAIDTVADTPSVTNATTSINTQTTSGLVISRNPADGAEVTHFKITNIVNGTLFQNDGTTAINANDFITFAQGNAGLKFTPGAGLTSPGSSFSFDVQASISNTNGGLGGGIATAMITVNPTLTITVNTLGDAADLVLDGACDTDAGTAGDQCTLRAAIQETNNAASDDIINFSLPSGSTIVLLSALDVLSGNVVINGPGANMLTVRRDGAAPNFRIFRTSPGTLVTISGLTIANGSDVHGGGIYNDHGNLRVEAVTFDQNSAPGAAGGAIYNDGQTSGSATLMVINTTFSGNSAAGGTGGAIYNNGINGTALLTVVNTTFSGNSAANGGAIGNEGSAAGSATLRIFNSTFSGNNATVSGGGILNLGTTGNTVLEIVNTILNHGTGANIVNTGTGTVTSQGHNLSSDAAGGDGATGPGGLLNQSGDQRNTNPRLGPLANNGGPTLTHALLAGSPALDAGDNAFVTDPPFSGPGFTDQRGAGFARILDAADAGTVQTVDIGAFEADPSVEDISDKATTEDTALPTFTFNVGDAATAFDSITAVSSNQILVPDANIIVGPDTASTRTLSITPAANESGATTITVTVTKTVAGTVVSMSDTFVLTVTGDNDIPTTTGIPDVNVNEDAADTVITLTSFFNDLEDGSAGLIYTVQANTNPGLFTSTNISSGVLTLDYAPNAFGTADITIRATDSGGLFVDDTFTVTVTSINDAPTLDALGNLTIDEDAVAQTVNLAGISDGGSEGQTLTVTAVSNNTSLIPNPTVTYTSPNSTGSLSFTPVANQNGGPVTITVTVMDNGGTGGGGIDSSQRTFTVTVNAVNDAPTFQLAGNPPTINEDDAAQTVNSFASNFQPGPLTATDEAGQTLVGYTVTLTGTTGNLAFTSGPSIDNAGTLTYTPSANTSGTATFNAVATDSGSGTPPNVNQSAPVAFTITVNAVNDPPVNSVPGAQSVTENSTLTFSTANANAISISDVDAGANPVQVTLTAANGLMTLGTVAGLSFTTGDGVNDAVMTFTGSIAGINTALNGLVFTPTPGFDGAASIQIVTNDQGNTGSGGALSDTDTVTINVLDGGTLAFSSATYTIGESGPVATITVNRSGGSNGEARIDYATSNGTASGGGTDYTTATGTLVFANGVTTQTFTVAINNDAIDEADETVNLTLSNPQGSGALGSPSTAVLTITDDDPLPSISIDDPSVTEGNSGTANLVFTVTLSNPSSQTVTVNYATGNNTAEAPGDFVAIPATLLTFNPLETSRQVTVLVNGDTDFEANEALELNLSSPANATLADTQGLGFIVDDDAPGGTVAFSSSAYTVDEDAGSIIITVNRTGTTTQAVTVDYATLDISASERSDYTTTLGTLNFASGATSASFMVPVNVDSFTEGSELVQLTLSNPSTGVALGVPQTAVLQIDNVANALPNTMDDPGHFVDQHYHDFLNRVPDAAGRAFWIDQITSCGSDAACIELRRINVSAAFFLSIEFQETGVAAFLTNTAAFGTALPGYRPFERDTQALQRGFVFTAPGSAVVLEANKVAFFNAFVARPEFTAIYGSSTNEQYVDALIANTGVLFTAPERDALVNGLNAATETRATVLRKITEKSSFKQAQFNRTFVYMQYIGYLRRNPADPPDNNLDGFNFWLNKLNQFNGNFIEAEMVKAFISSTEYRQRFGQ